MPVSGFFHKCCAPHLAGESASGGGPRAAPAAAPRIVDVHNHLLVPAAEEIAKRRPGHDSELERKAAAIGSVTASYNAAMLARLRGESTDIPRRLADMDRNGIRVQAVSPSPTQYYYWADAALAAELVDAVNAAIAALCRERPDRFVGLGAVALQHPDLACEQLRHAVAVLGMRGVEISTSIGGTELDDPRHEQFWREAERLQAVIFIHPLGTSLGSRVSDFYLSNIIGQPLETTIALSRLIFGGVMDRFPGLKLCAAHGGGYLPSYAGRTDWGARVRPECRTPRLPSEYLRSMYFDSLVYEPSALSHLVRQVGADRVVVGTDYPFDMGHPQPLALLAGAALLDSEQREAIAHGNARRLLRLD